LFGRLSLPGVEPEPSWCQFLGQDCQSISAFGWMLVFCAVVGAVSIVLGLVSIGRGG
jgi:hypothetical protein